MKYMYCKTNNYVKLIILKDDLPNMYHDHGILQYTADARGRYVPSVALKWTSYY